MADDPFNISKEIERRDTPISDNLRELAALETDELLGRVSRTVFSHHLKQADWEILDWGQYSVYAMDPDANTYEWYGFEDADKVRHGVREFSEALGQSERDMALEMLGYPCTEEPQ